MYCILLYCSVLYCTVLYCIVLYCIVFYCIGWYCIFFILHVQYCRCLIIWKKTWIRKQLSCFLISILAVLYCNIVYSLSPPYFWTPYWLYSSVVCWSEDHYIIVFLQNVNVLILFKLISCFPFQKKCLELTSRRKESSCLKLWKIFKS